MKQSTSFSLLMVTIGTVLAGIGIAFFGWEKFNEFAYHLRAFKLEALTGALVIVFLILWIENRKK